MSRYMQWIHGEVAESLVAAGMRRLARQVMAEAACPSQATSRPTQAEIEEVAKSQGLDAPTLGAAVARYYSEE